MCLPNGMPNGLFSLPDDVGVLVFQLLLDKDSLALLRRTREKAHEVLSLWKGRRRGGHRRALAAQWRHSVPLLEASMRRRPRKVRRPSAMQPAAATVPR